MKSIDNLFNSQVFSKKDDSAAIARQLILLILQNLCTANEAKHVSAMSEWLFDSDEPAADNNNDKSKTKKQN